MNIVMMILLWTYLFLVVPSSFAALHPSSPCPSVFYYEGTKPENERWYGVALLSTDESLVGVRLDVRLDRPAEILVSWMGTVTTDNNERFTILSLDQKLHPGPPTPSRFMVKFNSIKGSPQVRTIRLNGRQICPPDPSFPTDVQSGSQDHLYENKYTTERVTRRPDLDFDDDWTNSRPQVNPSRAPSTSDSYKPPREQNPSSYNGGETSGHNNHGSVNVNTGPSYQKDKPTGTNSYNTYSEREPVRTTTYGYDSHETYHKPRPTGSSSSGDSARPSGTSGQSGYQNNQKPLVTENTQYINPDTSISININKPTYVERPGTLGYNSETNVAGRPSTNREPPHINNNVNTKTTEKYHEHDNSGHREEVYVKPTTKKPVVINSINISIQTNDDGPSVLSSTGTSRTTTKRPYGSSNNNKNTNNGNNNQQTPSRPSNSDSQRPSSTNGYQSTRPNRNPDISSSESQYQPGYGQNNNERTTEKNDQGSNSRPSSSQYRPSAVPSNRPSNGNENTKIPRPSTTNGQKHGDDGDLVASNPNIKCGQVAVNPAPLITHGQNTARGQWPWHIALYRIEGINLSYSCGGSLVSATVVVTAAHCVTKAPRDRPVDAEILVVQLGKYHLYQFSDDSVQNKQVRDVYVHPNYNSTNYLDDIAILILSTPAEFTKFVRPVCLWPKHHFNLPNIDNKEGTVVGWGYDENNQVTEELKMARMPVVSYVTCLKSYPQFFSQFTAENKTFCAGFRQGTSVCNGDSGGGMVFQQDGVWYLRGLVSITVAKQGLRVCDTNHYVVFTDIANYLDWIGRYL